MNIRSRFARFHPKLYLGAHGIVGLAASAACMWLFFALADEMTEQRWLVHVDLAVTQWLQMHGTERGESIFVGVSYLGAQVLIAVLVVAGLTLLARRDWRHLAVLCVTCGGGALLNVALKLVYHRARPAAAAEFETASWSFPSGHAMDSLIVYGLAAYWLRERFPRARTPILVGAIVVVGSIGFARIYLGVHYLSDVVAGFLGGFVWLTVCVTGYQFAERRRIGPAGADEAPAG